MTSQLENLRDSLRHPVVFIVLVTASARVFGLARYYFGVDPQGNKLSASSLVDFIFATSCHVAEICLIGIAAYCLWCVAGRLRRVVFILLVLLFGCLVLLGQVDLEYLRYVGQRFTYGVFATYFGPQVVDADMYEPLVHEKGHLVLSIGTLVIAWGLMLRRLMTDKPVPGERSIAASKVLGALGICGLVALPLLLANPLQRALARSPEAGFVLALAGADTTSVPLDVAQATQQLRSAIRLETGERWAGEGYPLVRVPARADKRPRTASGGYPDIVLFVIESLRGAEVGYGATPPRPSPTPHLDQLARRSVVFPHYIANGDPSARGFFSIHASLWPHRSRFAIANFPNLNVSSIPGRLKRHGYRNLIFWGSNPGFDNQLAWARRWYDHLDFELPENALLVTRRMSDRAIMDRVIDAVARHDAGHADRPFFAYVASTGTHSPYTLEDSYFEPLSAAGDADRVSTGGIEDVRRRYHLVLKNVDFHINRVIEQLKQRPRWRDTVVIVVGDHANNTDEPVAPELRGLPVNFRVWTSALIYGPEKWIGPPGRRAEPASHVDLLPTLLALVGDDQPFASVGRDLFVGTAQTTDTAVAVRERGARVDRDGVSLYLPNDAAGDYFVRPSFPGAQSSRRKNAEANFSDADVKDWRGRIDYLSYLMEQDRIWDPVLTSEK